MQLTMRVTRNRQPYADLSKAGVPLWIVQGLLALLFSFAGGMKLVTPSEILAGFAPLPVVFLRFIGVCEVLGALGLILPGFSRIQPGLTPLAAAGLVIIMIGATTVTLMGSGVAQLLYGGGHRPRSN